MAVMIGIDPHKGSHAAVAVGAAETRTCLLVQARSQHDFAKSARRSGVRRCSASPLNSDLQVNRQAPWCDEFGGAQPSK